MSLEDFGREVMGKPPKNRDMWDRMLYTDEDGDCSYDMQVATTPLSWPLALAVIGGLALVGWAANDPEWQKWAAKFTDVGVVLGWLFGG